MNPEIEKQWDMLLSLSSSTNTKKPELKPQSVEASIESPPEQTVSLEKGDFSHVTNAEFISAFFSKLPDGVFPAVCSKSGNPKEGGWPAKRANSTILLNTSNNYLSCSSFRPRADGTFNVQRDQLAAYHFLMLDDLGTKIPMERLGNFELSYLVETSPVNFQGGIILAEPIIDFEVADRLSNAVRAAGLCDENSSGLGRWARLPNAINGKPEHRDKDGKPFKCRLVQWRPEKRYTVQEVIDGLKLELPPKKEEAETPRVTVEVPAPRRETTNTSLEKLEAVVDRLDPDCGYDQWSRIGMGIYHETRGSDEGFDLFNRFSSKGSKYQGIKDIKVKWRSFRPVENPVTIGSLIMMAKEVGADVAAIMQLGEEDFEVIEDEAVASVVEASTCTKVLVSSSISPSLGQETTAPSINISAQGAGNPLSRYFINDIEKLEKWAVEQCLILGLLILMGQATVIYAKHNTGKTLLMLWLIIQGIIGGKFDPSKLIYINMDDDSHGLITKLKLAVEYGFRMVADGHQGFEAKEIRIAMEKMITTDTASGVIIVLDTLKKFVNTMKKDECADFAKVVRRFVLKGGTVIALAHVNKNPGKDNKAIYSGTTDIIDDFDCAYILS